MTYLKIYNRYRLVRFSPEGRLLTDAELEAILTAEKYQYQKVKLPNYVPAAPKEEDYPGDWPAFQEAWKLWQTTVQQPEDDRYARDYAQRASVLAKKFKMARYVVDRLNANGTNHYTWVIDVPMAYSFLQAAMKLNTLKTADTIHFICSEYFAG